MASRQTISYVSDLSGAEIELSNSTPTVHFELDDIAYAIDLTSAESSGLRAALDLYVASARRRPPTPPTSPRNAPRTERPSAQQIRTWALENGFAVPSRGRIPAAAAEAYELAH